MSKLKTSVNDFIGKSNEETKRGLSGITENAVSCECVHNQTSTLTEIELVQRERREAPPGLSKGAYLPATAESPAMDAESITVSVYAGMLQVKVLKPKKSPAIAYPEPERYTLNQLVRGSNPLGVTKRKPPTRGGFLFII